MERGARVGVVSSNSLPWALSAYASYAAGAAFVPMYPNQGPREWEHVLVDSGSSVVWAANETLKKRLQELSLPGVRHILSHDQDLPRLLQAATARSAGSRSHGPTVLPDDLAGIIYTSGTSGKPKGVELTHANITSNVLGIAYQFEHIIGGTRCLSFLPWAHAYAQTVELHAGIALGLEFAICQGVEHLRDNLVASEPHLLFAVPSLFEKIYAGVRTNVAKQSALKQSLFNAAVAVARERARLKRRGASLGALDSLKYSILNSLVLSKVKAALGPNLRIAVSGGARLDPDIMEFFEALGLDVYEGYGLTETSPILAANTPDFKREGTVGRELPGVRVTIRDPATQAILPAGQSGEVCGSGPNIFRCYHNLPAESAQHIFTDETGARTFRTGDVGHLTEEGALVITGRIKEQYKLKNGKVSA